MTIAVRNPRTGEADYAIEAVSPAEIAAVAGRLRTAQPAWQALGADGRAAVLLRWAEAIQANLGAIVGQLSIDTGRLHIAQIEAFGVIGTIQRWATVGPDMIRALDLNNVPSATPGVLISNRHVPFPLLGVIAPWNFPLLLALIDAVPALLAGCAALIKPSEITPRFIPELRKTIEAVPELAAVLAVVEGSSDPTAADRALVLAAARRPKRVPACFCATSWKRRIAAASSP